MIDNFDNINKSNFLKLDLTNHEKQIVTCVVCGASESIDITDNFWPFNIHIRNAKGEFTRSLTIKNPKQQLRVFQDKHYFECVCPVKEPKEKPKYEKLFQ